MSLTGTFEEIRNFIGGEWRGSAAEYADVVNPATAEVVAKVPLTPAEEVGRAVRAGADAFETWRRVPVTERIQYLFRFKQQLESHLDELAKTITTECGKTLNEAVGEMRRGIENVEVACGMPSLIQGYNNEDIASGIDEHMIRQPLGVVAAITPFNFPGMIPLWFMPYAIACGNCFLLKPSEKVPLTSARLFELLAQTGLPKGVAQLVNGGRATVDALLDHPAVRAISFVGSSPVAKYVYARATANGKRAQCQGGAKNPVIIMPDADPQMTTEITADSAFGCAGQRCLAASVAITVGEAREPFAAAISEAARNRAVGYGLDSKTQMGPVITPESKSRIEQWIGTGEAEGARVLVDGRGKRVSGYEKGNFVGPTVLENVDPRGTLARTEIFGPVLSMTHAATIEDAIAMVNASSYGNMACLFTSSGAAARRFRSEVVAGNIGINVGVAAPMAFFPFSGWKESFFGDLHGQGRHGVEFYTQTKVVVERWPREWSRRF
jgi:malonate-semialdehyde dehydrogenase (acetylating)/methylmalonate-semialdehyde dehydrogenase